MWLALLPWRQMAWWATERLATAWLGVVGDSVVGDGVVGGRAVVDGVVCVCGGHLIRFVSVSVSVSLSV